jgi:hypothetical protein
MRTLFARHPKHLHELPTNVEVVIPRVFVRHGTDFIIQYLLRGTGSQPSFGREKIMCGYLPGPGSKTAIHLDSSQTLDDADTGLRVPLFPYDPQLPQLKQWVDTSRVAQQMDAVPGRSQRDAGSPSAGIEAVEVLAYRLGRRCTLGISFTSDATGLVAKIMGRSALERALAADRHLRSQGTTDTELFADALPSLLGASQKLGVLLMEHVPGRSLHDLWTVAECHEACGAAGRLLAALHAMTPGEGPARTLLEEWTALTTRMQLICTIFPELCSVWKMAEKRLESLMPEPDSQCAQIHGDFYDKQVLFEPGRVTLLDYDTLGRGEPAMDVGNFLAHGELRKMQDSASALRIEAGMVEFQRAYGESDVRPLEAVMWWKAMTLARLSGLYALRPRWRNLSQSLLAAAVHTMETVQNHV